jgi:hypothetical protein
MSRLVNEFLEAIDILIHSAMSLNVLVGSECVKSFLFLGLWKELVLERTPKVFPRNERTKLLFEYGRLFLREYAGATTVHIG